MAVRAGFMSDNHKALVKTLYETGHLIPTSDKIMVLRKDLGLDEVPSTVLKDEEALKQVRYIMEQTRLLMIIKES